MTPGSNSSGDTGAADSPRRRPGSSVAIATETLGATAVSVTDDIGGLVKLTVATLLACLRLRVDVAEVIRHTERLGLAALPLVLGGAAIVGGVVAMQGLGYVARYSATEAFGWAAGLSAFREVGPLLLGLTLAARVGTKNTAELASMTSKERIDALVALRLDEERVVLVPRILAITITSAIAFPFAAVTILGSAFLLASIIGDQRISGSVWSVLEYIPARQVLEGFARLCAFGAVVAVVSTYYGRRSGRGARSIGAAVYASSVASISAIVVVNLWLSLLAGAR